MGNNNKSTIKITKRLLVNMLHHIGCNHKTIQKIANVSLEDINSSIVN